VALGCARLALFAGVTLREFKLRPQFEFRRVFLVGIALATQLAVVGKTATPRPQPGVAGIPHVF